MKILYCLPSPSHRLSSKEAGHIVRANAILDALRDEGHEIIVVQAADSQTTQAAATAHRSLVRRFLPRLLALCIRDVARILFTRRFAARVIETIRNEHPDCILETHLALTVAGLTASKATDCPLVIDDLAPWWEEETEYGVGFRRLARSVYDKVTTQARLLVAVSSEIRQSLIDIGHSPEKIALVSNAIDERALGSGGDGAAIRRKFKIPEDALVIVFTGSFQNFQRIDSLITSFAELQATTRPLHLLLVGDGNNRPLVEALVQKLGIAEKVTFTGHVPYDTVAEHTAAGDIAALPAALDYGNPMKLYDYMAQGKAMVAPDQSTVTDIVRHGESALLFEKGNVEAMTAALRRLIEDPDLRRTLGQRAGALARENTWQRRGQTLSEAMQKIVGAGRGAGHPVSEPIHAPRRDRRPTPDGHFLHRDHGIS